MTEKINLNDGRLSFHFVGVFGIGMSGLAQFLRWKGFGVSGSDRALDFPENKMIKEGLSEIGVKLYSQDGSYVKAGKPDYIVYSTAIEEDNADFIAADSIPRLHRTELLVELFNTIGDKTSIAVAGTCGKTTVSSLLTETFDNLGLEPFSLVGGFINSFIKSNALGNFVPGNGEWTIFESDESDKSLLRFHPDYSILLNLGTDHYSKEELKIVFEQFLKNTKKGAVIEQKLYDLLDPESYKHLDIVIFSDDEKTEDKDIWTYKNYSIKKNIVTVSFQKSNFVKHFKMPVPGRYNAGNFLAVFALFELLELSKEMTEEKYLNAMAQFKGVHRRFEYSGKTSSGVNVYCDFAHNVDKIESALKCAKELTDGNVYAVFQPHGYKPLRFMKEELYPAVDRVLGKNDRFILLPVFYSGGTCTPNPRSEDVIAEFSGKCSEPQKFQFFEERKENISYFRKELKNNDIIVIMGARDNTLPIWAKEIAETL